MTFGLAELSRLPSPAANMIPAFAMLDRYASLAYA
jgi:hypothetical protein